ncbi:MAG: patatin-like phospholipase family protein [Proteobacteria bacterium]|nr:patatin-like phospholipase family protein [Pseudomonadota bacterium]
MTASKGAKAQSANEARAPAAQPAAKSSANSGKAINLALQGGGSHGAFAWGVIDRLLEHGEIDVEVIVGTSAGAMNAAVTAYGLAVGGREGARETLRAFWRKTSDAARLSPMQPTFLDKLQGRGSMDTSPGWLFMDAISKIFSPYQLNPFNLNPLRDTLLEVVDFDRLRHGNVKLYICATNVLTGKIKVFEPSEMSIDAVMASACLPFMFQAVEVNGEHYWDGGYMGNPPLYPIIYNAVSRDILIVQLNPIKIPEVPTQATQILDRINTLSFNSSLMREMRAISFVTNLIEKGFDDNGRLKRVHIHTIDAEDVVCRLGVSSKLNADWDFLSDLHELGRQRCEQFLTDHYDKIGKQSSTDIEAKFL